MQMNEKQTLLAGAAALALIVFGALFWIAPVWQFGYAPAAYQRLFCRRRLNLHRNHAGRTGASQHQYRFGRRADAAARHWAGKSGTILADRAVNGPYAAPEDLTRVKGISQRMVQQWGSRYYRWRLTPLPDGRAGK